MTRIAEFSTIQKLMYMVQQHRQNVDKLSDALSSGINVRNPGDSTNSGSIAQMQKMLERAEGHKNRIATVTGMLAFQDNTLSSASDLLVRATEIATQAANESNSAVSRAQLAEEVFQIRDHMVNLANSTYQGKYVWGGLDDDTPPYSDAATWTPDAGYTNPTTGEAHERWVFNSDPAALLTKTVKISDDVRVTVNTPGNQVFENAIQALERLGRALSGYKTEPPTGAPDGSGDPYTLPEEFADQTKDIQNCIDLLKKAREVNIMPERVDIGGRLRRLETAESLIELSKTSGQEILDRLQSTDMFAAASEFSVAQTALQAALLVNSQVLNQSVLDYL